MHIVTTMHMYIKMREDVLKMIWILIVILIVLIVIVSTLFEIIEVITSLFEHTTQYINDAYQHNHYHDNDDGKEDK